MSPALCNRIDRNTSGIVLAAKNAAALRELNQRIRTGRFKSGIYVLYTAECRSPGRH